MNSEPNSYKLKAISLDGKKEAAKLLGKLKQKVSALHTPITLATILVGRRPDSVLYVKRKQQAAINVGIKVRKYQFPTSISQKKLDSLLERLNRDSHVHGILLQLPLPTHLKTSRTIAMIPPSKDVDGFQDHPRVVPPTVAAVLHLLRLAKPKQGARAIILGKKSVFTKDLSVQLHNAGSPAGVVLVAHKIPMITRKADIIITALGRNPRLTAADIKPGAIVIDVGIRRMADKTVGDADPSVWTKAKAVSPVPGGVGPLTVAYVLYNTYHLAITRNI